MSQQPLMSSFSALEFHAGHYKGTASLAAEAARLLGDHAAILVNRFIMPEGRVSCRRHALETIVSVWSGWLFLISQRKITTRRRTRRAKETRPETTIREREKKSMYQIPLQFRHFFSTVRGIFRSFLFDLLNRATNLTLTCNIDIRIRHNYARPSHAELVPGEVREWGPFRFESASIKTPRTGRTNCRIYRSLMGRTWIRWIHPVIVKISIASEKKRRSKSERQRREDGKRNTRERTRRTYKYKMFTFLS